MAESTVNNSEAMDEEQQLGSEVAPDEVNKAENGENSNDIENGVCSAEGSGTKDSSNGGSEDTRKGDNGNRQKFSAEGSEEESVEQTGAEGKQIQSLEIDTNSGNETDESFEDDGDMEHLLGGPNDSTEKATQSKRYPICARPERVGNMRIFLPGLFARTGFGIAGPHFCGPVCVLFLLGLASHYFIDISMRRIGPITTAICVIFLTASIYNLANVAYRDPGVVKLQPASQRPQDTDDDQRLQFRWCDRCQVFQPVDGAHCSDCNVCIAGFDHHCVWMGTCIGKNNFKEFVRFNITWLLYLMFAVTWVSVLGPIIFGRHNTAESETDSSP